MRTTHELKIWPEYFAQVRNGRMKFQLRRNDRDFKVGDQLLLKEWKNQSFLRNRFFCKDCGDETGECRCGAPTIMQPISDSPYTGRELLVRVDYILKVEDLVICGAIMDVKAPDYVIMSISLVS
jgi:hypothetical protein